MMDGSCLRWSVASSVDVVGRTVAANHTELSGFVVTFRMTAGENTFSGRWCQRYADNDDLKGHDAAWRGVVIK